MFHAIPASYISYFAPEILITIWAMALLLAEAFLELSRFVPVRQPLLSSPTLAAICVIDRPRGAFIPGRRRRPAAGITWMPTESCLVKTMAQGARLQVPRGFADPPPVRQGKENETSKGYANRFVESGHPRFSILWTPSTRYPFQYYGRVQHDSSPCIHGSAPTVPNCPVGGRGQSVA